MGEVNSTLSLIKVALLQRWYSPRANLQAPPPHTSLNTSNKNKNLRKNPSALSLRNERLLLNDLNISQQRHFVG